MSAAVRSLSSKPHRFNIECTLTKKVEIYVVYFSVIVTQQLKLRDDWIVSNKIDALSDLIKNL